MKLKVILFSLFVFCLVGCETTTTDSGDLELTTDVSSNISSNGTELELDITSSGDWMIQSDAIWCTPVPSEGNGNCTIKLLVGANINSSERSASVTLSANGRMQTIRLTQDAADPDAGEYHYELPVIFHVLYDNEADENQDVQAAASQAQDAYDNLLDSGEYNNYISEWLTSPESYTILDINQDQIPELMVHSADDGTGWSNTLLFAYDSEAQEAKMVQDIYHYMDIRYSAKYKAIVYSDVRSSLMYGGSGFFVLDGTELTQAFSVGWDNTSYANAVNEIDENHYFIFQGDTRTEITEAQNDEYFDELSDIEKTQL